MGSKFLIIIYVRKCCTGPFVDVMVKQVQAQGLYARLFLLFNIITIKSSYYSLTLHYGFRFLVVVHENRSLSLGYVNMYLVFS